MQRRIMVGEPAEEVLAGAGPQVERTQAQHRAAGVAHGVDHLAQLLLGVAQCRQHRGDQRAGADPAVGQAPHGLDAQPRVRAARLGGPPHLRIERPHREIDAYIRPLRRGLEDVEVSGDER